MLDVRIAPAGTPPDGAARTAGDAAQLRVAGAEQARALTGGSAVLCAAGLSGPRLTAFVEGLVLGAYRFALPGARAAPRPTPLRRVELVDVDDEPAIGLGLLAAGATVWARDLTNTRAATKTPAWLATQAARVLPSLGVGVEIRDGAWLAEQGFGGVLAVGGGAAAAPRLIEARWRPRGARPGLHPVIAGKGITFDTGGLNLKPGQSMRTMHTDMAGGAAALAALRIVAEQRLPLRVTVLVPVAENSFSGSAFRPGDVVRHFGGRTSEINNTDAEGRLVLADAMAYAVARLRPTALVDIATLTGAMKVALGVHTGGVFASSDRLARALVQAGKRSGEPLWRLPLHSDYEAAGHSEIADGLQTPPTPGAITAALFLRPFAGAVPWAHLDIAGPARADADAGLNSRGATGFGARLLAAWLTALAS